jgi:hypothetical protein
MVEQTSCNANAAAVPASATPVAQHERDGREIDGRESRVVIPVFELVIVKGSGTLAGLDFLVHPLGDERPFGSH